MKKKQSHDADEIETDREIPLEKIREAARDLQEHLDAIDTILKRAKASGLDSIKAKVKGLKNALRHVGGSRRNLEIAWEERNKDY